MADKGFTLAELLLVVALVVVLASTLILRNWQEDAEHRLELAGSEITSALRFARSEAMRTSQHYGVTLPTATDEVRVYQLDTSRTPFRKLYSVRHPVDRKVYDFSLVNHPFASGVDITRAEFQFMGESYSRHSVSFSATGAPVSPETLAELAETGLVEIAYRGEQRSYHVTPSTGRVEASASNEATP